MEWKSGNTDCRRRRSTYKRRATRSRTERSPLRRRGGGHRRHYLEYRRDADRSPCRRDRMDVRETRAARARSRSTASRRGDARRHDGGRGNGNQGISRVDGAHRQNIHGGLEARKCDSPKYGNLSPPAKGKADRRNRESSIRSMHRHTPNDAPSLPVVGAGFRVFSRHRDPPENARKSDP